MIAISTPTFLCGRGVAGSFSDFARIAASG
jgi:hypothetical protein